MRTLIAIFALAAVTLASPVPQEQNDISIDGEIELGQAVPDLVVYGNHEDEQVTYFKQPVTGKIVVGGGASGKGGKWGGNIHVGGEIRFSRTPEQEAELASEAAEGYGIKIEGEVKNEGGKWSGGVRVGGSISFSDADALEQAPASYKEPVKGKIFVKGDGHGKGRKWSGNVVVGGEIRFTAPAKEVARYSLNGEEYVLYKQPIDGKVVVSGGASGKGGKWTGDINVRGVIHFLRPLAEVVEGAKDVEDQKLKIGGHLHRHHGKWHGSVSIGGSVHFSAPEEQIDESLAYKEPVSGKIIVSGGASGKGGKWGGNIHVGGQIRF